MNILNREALNEWLFQHGQIQVHTCVGIKDGLKDELGLTVNTSFIDIDTGERFEIVYDK